MSKIPAINEIDANSPSQESKEVVIKATDVSPDINEIQETISSAATIQEVDGTRKPTISEIYKIVTDGLFESTSNWWDYAYKLSQAQINQDIISRLDKGEIGGGYSKGVDIITTTKNAIPTNTNVYSALKSDTLYPKKLNNETINGIYNFVNGITIGKPTAYTGGTWSVDQLGKTHLSTDYLYVRLKAIFETLQILNVDTIGGKLIISPAGSITIVYVDNIKVTIDGNEQNVYRCYFLGEQEGEEIENKWKVGDQAQAKSFNVKKGTYHKIGNHYLWRLVVGASTDTVTIDGKKYHYVDLSQLIFDVGSDAPAPGDVLNQLGHRGDDLQRQTAIVLNAVDNYAPSITLYAGITDFTLLNKEYVEYGVYQGKAFFNVYGDMYIGDKGINPTTYIKFKNGKIDIKANLTIGSSIDGKDLDKYIKENGGVDEETVKSLINNAQVIKDLQNQADGAIETWFYEGEPTLKNLPAIDWTTNEIKKIHVGDLYYDQITGFAYRFTRYNDDVTPYAWNRIKDNDIVKALEAASHAQATADSKMKIFYGEAKPTNYQAGDMWVNATLAGKFDNDIARSTTKSETFDADHWVLASRYSEAIQSLLNWSNQYTTKFEDLTKIVKEQKDQSISNWFYDYEPTDSNAPANLWNTEELRNEHIGDIFYDTKNNHSYRWTGSAWSMIKDADFDEAMKKAKEAADLAGDASDLADKKRQIFYTSTTPTGGDRGDLWMKQVGTKTEVWVFDGTNWVKSNDKALADYSETINKELQGIKGQLDGKAETWYQANDPSTNWTNKTSHEGDIWYNTTDGTTQYWNGTKWEKMDIPKDVFDTIDGKSSIFVDSYDDAKAGKGVISNGYNERDIWILPADAIVNGVQYYKGDILTATADGTVFNEKHWTKKVRYVGDKELTAAIDKVNKKINDISATTLPGLDNKFNEFAKDGIIDSSEKARLTDLLNQANNDVLAANDQITSIIKSDYLDNDNVNKGKLIEAQKTLSAAWNEYKTLINTLIASENPITKNNIAEASSKYTNLQNSIKAVKQYLAACQADMLSNIGIDINSYKYLKEAFKGKTEVNGGLVVTNVLQLRQTSDANSPITAGISGLQGKANENGVVDKDTYDITSIAAWFGGPMVDRNIFTDEQLKNKVAGTDYARSLFRHDGSGYLASGAIYWGTDGILHGDPNSFILQGTSFATMFNYVRLFYLHYANNQGEGITGVDYITPTKTFSRLDILTQGGTEAGLNLPTGLFIGNSTTGGSFQIGNIIIRTKDGNPNILEIVSATDGKTAHLGVQGGISAYGTYTPSTGGGGGLNATIVSYANIIAGNYSDTDLTTIPNAYSIKALYNAIQNIDVTGQLGNYLLKTDAADTYQPKGNYLTAHQTIYGLTIQKNGKNVGTYNPKSKASTIDIAVPTKVSELTNDSGYTDNTGTVTSVGISVPTGLSATNSPITTKGIIAITFAEGYSIPTIAKQTSWDNISTLESYFNNGSAKKALQLTNARKLWGNSFNGTSDINGSIIVPGENYISIGDVKLIYDATNKALKIDGNLYSTGGISAYGTNNVAGGGGGLNATIVSYANIIAGNYSDTDLTTIPNAYSIKALYNAIQNIDVTGQLGNYLLKTDAADTYQPKGNYLTAHQTIYGLTIQKNGKNVGTYNPKSKASTIDIAVPTKVSELTNDSGYTDNTGTVTSVGISVPTGLSATNSPITTKGIIAITFAEGYSIPTIAKQTSWDNISTLESYFNNGSAKKALQLTNARKLWGNSFNGTSDINGSIIVPGENYISIGDVKLIYDATNKALKIDGNLYSTGGISAYGTNNVAGGGGLNASVISYASILEGSYVDTDLTSIPNAYSVKALSNRIDNIATELGDLNLSWNNITGKPTTFTPSAHKHKWVDITDRITKVSQLTNDAGYLTTHQSLSSYYTKAEIDAKGYTTNKGTVTSIGLTLPTGLVCATKTITTSGTFAISLASGYSIPTTTKQSSWDSAVSVKHSHSNKSVLDGISSAKVTHWDSAYNWYSLMTTDEETADGIINKWNEVVNFLANIAQTDTLSGIINGINTSISNEVSRAKKAEGTNASNISANKTSITTLQGYFTSGSAKKALQLTNTRKLWGNAFNGTADVNGSIVLPNGKYISIGNIKLEYDATNKALKITNTTTDEVANLYASGGVSAYGVGSVAGSGGSLNGSVLSYDLAIKLTNAGDNELSQLASAWSIAKLNSRISSLEGGSALDVVTSGTGNAVTGISKNGTTINVTKGTSFLTSHQSLVNYLTKTDASNTYLTKSAASSTYQPKGNYLTAHQSLDGYVNNIVTSGTGNAITSVTKSGKTVTFTKGSTFLTSHQSLANCVQTVTTIGSGNAVTAISKSGSTISVTKGATFLTSHQILDHLISVDHRSLVVSPTMYNRGVYPMFISNTTDHLNDGGAYHGILHWRSYGDGNNLSGGYPIQIAYTANGRLWTRIATSSTTWDAWKKIARTEDIPTKLSQLTNDKGYLTSHQSLSAYLKSANAANTYLKLSGGTMGGVITKNNGTSTINGRDGAIIRQNNAPNYSSWNTIACVKTRNGAWTLGHLTVKDKYDTSFAFCYTTDANYDTNNNKGDYVFLRDIGGTIALISEIPKNNNQLKNGAGYITSAGSCKYATSAGNADTVDGYHATSGRTFNGNINWSINWEDHWSDGTNTHPWYGFDHRYPNTGAYSTTLSDYFGMTIKTNNILRLDFRTLLLNGINIYNINVNGANTILGTSPQIAAPTEKNSIYVSSPSYSNNKPVKMLCFDWYGNYWAFSNIRSPGTNSAGFGVFFKNTEIARFTSDGNLSCNAASATKLKTARSIWGQSFDGTANVSGSITGVNNITMSNNSYLYGKNTSGTAIQLIAMASWNSIDIGRGALTNGYTTQVMGKTVALTASDDSGKNTKSIELSTAKFYSNVTIETEKGLLAHGGVTAYSSSDIRLKQNLCKLDYLNIIKAMGGSYGFTWRKDNKHSIGWIAQHVLNNPYMRDIVETDENGYYKINYWSPKLIATAFGAIEQVDDEVSKLKARVTYLESEVERLTNDNKLLMNK